MRLTLPAAMFVLVSTAALVSTGAPADDVLPTDTLRAIYIASNPVQAFVDSKSGETRGPGAELARELGRRLGVTVTIKPVQGAGGVLDAIKNGDADIGFVAFDSLRAVDVDFSQTYSLVQNTYIVPANSSIRSIAEVDKPGVRVGVAERDAGDLFLTRNLKHAEIRRNPGGEIAVGLKWMADGQIDAYAANRQRLALMAGRTKGIRLLPDNFYGVEQAVAVRKGNTVLLAIVDKFIDEARTSGLIAGAIERAGLVGVDVAPRTTR